MKPPLLCSCIAIHVYIYNDMQICNMAGTLQQRNQLQCMHLQHMFSISLFKQWRITSICPGSLYSVFLLGICTKTDNFWLSMFRSVYLHYYFDVRLWGTCPYNVYFCNFTRLSGKEFFILSAITVTHTLHL